MIHLAFCVCLSWTLTKQHLSEQKAKPVCGDSEVLEADRCYINEISFKLLLLYYIELSHITITKKASLPTQQRPSLSW